ncbi:hypothetical protein ACVW04_001717 [Bradyrhizobium sp. LM2.3]
MAAAPRIGVMNPPIKPLVRNYDLHFFIMELNRMAVPTLTYVT